MTGQTINYEALNGVPRLLMEVELKPRQGHRFQPTGFPDLGPARYTLPDGTEMLLVESPQSVANWMELACWDKEKNDLIPELSGLPYIRVIDRKSGVVFTTSIQEAHRINSPRILGGVVQGKSDTTFLKILEAECKACKVGPVNISLFAQTVFKYDTNAVIHGVFVAQKQLAGGRLRLPRLLSGFIEAKNVRPAESGGTKIDRVNPAGKTEDGFGNVPFHRTEFVAEEIKAYFNLDLGLIRGYGFSATARRLLVALSLLKVRRFFSNGLRLRSACDLEPASEIRVSHPPEFAVPPEDNLLRECRQLIDACTKEGLFATPPVTEVVWDLSSESVEENESSEA